MDAGAGPGAFSQRHLLLNSVAARLQGDTESDFAVSAFSQALSCMLPAQTLHMGTAPSLSPVLPTSDAKSKRRSVRGSKSSKKVDDWLQASAAAHARGDVDAIPVETQDQGKSGTPPKAFEALSWFHAPLLLPDVWGATKQTAYSADNHESCSCTQRLVCQPTQPGTIKSAV